TEEMKSVADVLADLKIKSPLH
ncbi:hypothetical protein LCGC14_3110140, partial [marine sediment metagenome]